MKLQMFLRQLPQVVVFACAMTAGIALSHTVIPNGKPYLDSNGTHIQAHGGFVLKHNGAYYWVGEDKSHNSARFKAMAMYKSTDLENWIPVGPILTTDTRDTFGNRVLAHSKVERPKLLFNAATNKFVLWGHWENASSYAPSHVVVATADNIEGPYTVTSKGHFRPGEGDPNGVGYFQGVPAPKLNATKNSDGSYPTFIPGYPSYPMFIESANAASGSHTELGSIRYTSTFKAVAVVQDAEGYPGATRSPVARVDYTIGQPASVALVAPAIYPVTTAGATVTVNSNGGDKAHLVAATSGASIYYTEDGTTPVPGAAGTTLYVDGAGIALNANKTIKAITVKSGDNSAVSSVTYALAQSGVAAPLYAPVFSVPTSNSPTEIATVKLYSVSAGTVAYFTADGKDPDPPLKGENTGYGSRDFTLFQDPLTNKAYLVSAQDNVYLRVWQLTDDYTDVVPSTQYPMFIDKAREAPALTRHGNYIYMITSKQSGWYPNQLQYTRTLDIANKDAWDAQKSLADNTGWHSQPTQILNVATGATPEYLYLGDRWNPTALATSTYVWLPLKIDAAGTMSMQWTPETDINLVGGTVSGHGGRVVSQGQPVTATANASSTAAALRTPDQANDGVYTQTAHYYQPATSPWYWQVDLGANVELGRINLSFRVVGGSDAAHRYKVAVSTDGSTWVEQVNNSGNSRVGFQDHLLSGSYRYVRVNVSNVWDMVHNRAATGFSGILEATVYAKPADWNAATADWGFELPVTGTFIYNPSGAEWTFSGASGDGSGVTSNASAFTSGNPSAPQGAQLAFLQRSGSVTRDLTSLVPGKTYRVTVLAAQRANKSGGQLGQTFDTMINGASIGSFAPPQTATAYTPYSATFVAGAAFATLKFQGTNTRGGDNTIFLDQVDIDQLD